MVPGGDPVGADPEHAGSLDLLLRPPQDTRQTVLEPRWELLSPVGGATWLLVLLIEGFAELADV